MELSVGIAGNDALALGSHVDIGRGPIAGLDVREHRHSGVAPQLILPIHGVHRHFAELGPGERRAGPEGSVAVPVQDAHQTQGLHRHGGIPVADIGKSDRTAGGGTRRQCQQGHRRAHRQQQAQNSSFHICSPFIPPAALPPAGAWMLWLPDRCRTGCPAPPRAKTRPT